MPFDIYSQAGADEKFATPAQVAAAISEIEPGDIGAAPAPTGTPDGTKFYRDDGTWADPPAGGGGGSTLQIVGDADTPITDPNTTRPTADWVLWYADGIHPVNALATDLVVRVDEGVFDGTVEDSLEIVGGALQLVNDTASPGANKVYGTDGSGIKGWKADPAGSDPRRHPSLSSGQYLSLPVSRGTQAGADGQCRLVPVHFPQSQTITGLAVEVTTAAASSVVRIGIYADSNGAPGARLLDAGTVDASTPGVKIITPLTQAVGPGTVWIAVATQGGDPTLRSYTALNYFTQANATAIHALGGAPRVGAYLGGVTGALPSSLTLSQPQVSAWAVAWSVA